MVSDGKVRLIAVTTVVVACALFSYAPSAFAQTRPVLSPTFQSHVTIEITTGTGADAQTVEGAGEMIFNYPDQSREFYALGGPPLERVSRYDLDQIFTWTPPTCVVDVLTTDMVRFFDWVANSKMGASDEVNGVTGTTWVSTGTAPEPTLTLLATNDGKIPLYYKEATAERTVKIVFETWSTSLGQQPNLFRPPSKCSK